MNALFLLLIAVTVLKESVDRIMSPQEIKTDKLLLVSTLGLCVNLVGVFAFHDLHDHAYDEAGHSHSHGGSHSHSHGDSHSHSHGNKQPSSGVTEIVENGQSNHENHNHSHASKSESSTKKKKSHSADHDSNMYGVYLHVIADALGSVSVIISSLLIQYFNWKIADPICSFGISVLIFVGGLPLLKNSASTLLQCTPSSFESKMSKCLSKVTNVFVRFLQFFFIHFSTKIYIFSDNVC